MRSYVIPQKGLVDSHRIIKNLDKTKFAGGNQV